MTPTVQCRMCQAHVDRTNLTHHTEQCRARRRASSPAFDEPGTPIFDAVAAAHPQAADLMGVQA